MRERLTRIARGAVLLALVAGMAFPGVGFAGKDDKDDDKEHKGRREEERTEQARSAREDREMSGQVLEINTLKSPPELYMANRDGIVVVKTLKTDLIATNGVRLGDHITVTGEKIHEQLFEAQDLSVDGHLGDDPDDDD